MKVAVDGPAASGKSTTAKLIADQLDFIYVDSGAMYRAVALKWLAETDGVRSDNDDDLLAKIVSVIAIEFSDNGKTIIINGDDLSAEIRSSRVSQNVSYVASFASVREALVKKQRQISEGQDVIMDGRDIGTIVFPDAELKIFLVASAETRAKRRLLDLEKLGEDADLDALIKEIQERDELDSKREIAPLTKAKDAIEISTDNKSITEVTQEIISEIDKLTVV